MKGQGIRGLILGALVVVGLVVAQAQPSPRQQANDLAHALMSPFCPGKLLADCTSSQAYELRDTITRRLENGDRVDAIRADLVQQYGRAILGAPAAEGLGLLAWWVPLAIAIATAAGLGLKVTRATKAGAEAAAHRPALAASGDAAVVARLDDELRELD